MFSTALVIFREALEIAIILGIVLAATNGLPGRNKWVIIGAIAGIIGAGSVAFFTDTISNFAEGTGQELFNAMVLMTAALLIGWTVLWMHKHARFMKQKFKKVGDMIKEGEAPLYSLAVVVALALLREGSEIVMFTYGMAISGQSIASILTGCAIGFTAGFSLGWLLYFGLVKMSTKHIFQVTSWLLILLVSGLMSQAAAFLSAAGYFSEFSNRVWDTSAFLSEEGIVGQTLHVLLGYSAKPMSIQLIFYLTTLGVLVVTMKIMDRLSTKRSSAALVAAVVFGSLTMFSADEANATKKVYSPYVEKGELEFEWRGQYDNDHDSSKDGKQKQKFAVGYGFTDRWFSEVYGVIEKSPDADYKFSEVEWENRFQLTDQGEYWADFGLYTELKAPFENDSAAKAEVKLLAEKDFGKLVHTANVEFSEEFGDNANGGLGYGFAWKSRYLLDEMFEPGFEYHADFGRFNQDLSHDDQEHLIGPTAYGKLPHGFGYDIGYLFGASEDAPDGVIKAIFEYEIHF